MIYTFIFCQKILIIFWLKTNTVVFFNFVPYCKINYTLMKKIFFIYIILLASVFSFSQNSENNLSAVRKYIDEENFTKALNILSELEKDNEVTKNPVFWIYKGVSYHSLYDSETKTNIPKDSLLNLAYTSYKKAEELDADKNYRKSILEAYGFLVNQFTYEGVNNFNNGKQNAALNDFENSLAISSKPEFAYIDTVIYYNAGLAAEGSGNFDKAVKYYQKAIDLKFGNGRPYLDLAKLYKKQNDIDKYLYTLKEGLAFYPENTEIVNELINYYLSVSDVDNALLFVNKALKSQPDKTELLFIQGSLYETKKLPDSAIVAYEKAIQSDSTNSDVLYNLGAIYYNKGVNLIKHANTKDEKAKAVSYYKKAIPYMEKVSKLEPENKDVLYILKSAYLVTGQNDKKAEIEKKLKN